MLESSDLVSASWWRLSCRLDRMSRRIRPKSRCECQRPRSGGRSVSCRVISALTRRTSIDSTVTLGESIAVHRRLQYAIVHSALSSSTEKWPVLLLHGGGRRHHSALRRTAVRLVSMSFIAVYLFWCIHHYDGPGGRGEPTSHLISGW